MESENRVQIALLMDTWPISNTVPPSRLGSYCGTCAPCGVRDGVIGNSVAVKTPELSQKPATRLAMASR